MSSMNITLLLAAPLVKLILNKFYEGIGNALGEKAVELLPKKVQQIGQLVWDACLQDKPDAIELLQNAADNSAQAQKELKERISSVLEDDTELYQEVQELAEEIRQVINVDDVAGKNVQQVFGGQGEQFNNDKVEAPTIQGGSGHSISITYHNSSSDS